MMRHVAPVRRIQGLPAWLACCTLLPAFAPRRMRRGRADAGAHGTIDSAIVSFSSSITT